MGKNSPRNNPKLKEIRENFLGKIAEFPAVDVPNAINEENAHEDGPVWQLFLRLIENRHTQHIKKFPKSTKAEFSNVGLLDGVSEKDAKKDWYAVQILKIITEYNTAYSEKFFPKSAEADDQNKETKVILAGGLSLSKAYGYTNRLSGDLDFLIANVNGDDGAETKVNERNMARHNNRTRYRTGLEECIKKAIGIPEGAKASDGCYSPDKRWFFKSEVLKGGIDNKSVKMTITAPDMNEDEKLEIDIRFERPYLYNEVAEKDITPFVKSSDKSDVKVPVNCISFVETAANKFNALLWRSKDYREEDNSEKGIAYKKKADMALIRHLYDLGCLLPAIFCNGETVEKFSDLLQRIYKFDCERGNNGQDQLETFEQACQRTLSKLKNNEEKYEKLFEEFVEEKEFYIYDEKGGRFSKRHFFDETLFRFEKFVAKDPFVQKALENMLAINMGHKNGLVEDKEALTKFPALMGNKLKMVEKLKSGVKNISDDDRKKVMDMCGSWKNSPEMFESLRRYADIDTIINSGGDINTKYEHGTTLLSQAVRTGNIAEIKSLIDGGADVNSSDEYGMTALHYAAQEDVIELLIKAGANIGIQDNCGCTPLYRSTYDNRIDAVKALIARGANVDSQDENGLTPLYHAKQKEIVELLIRAGANINKQNESGLTPLHFAAYSNHVDTVEVLVASGSSINSLDKSNCTPLHYAAYNDSIDAIKALGALNANINSRDKDSRSPLYHAVYNDSIDAIKALVELDADIDIQDKFGCTPLHCAAYSNRVDAIKELVELGAKMDIKDNDGLMPLHCVARNNSVDAIKELVELGADVNSPDKIASTPLHHAVYYNRIDAINELVKRGADINRPDEFACTPLHYAAYNNSVDTIKKLIKLGANVNKQDWLGMTPLHQAVLKNNPDVVKILVKAGSDINKQNRAGLSPMQLADINSDLDASKVLKEEAAKALKKQNIASKKKKLQILMKKKSTPKLGRRAQIAMFKKLKKRKGR